MRNSQRSLNLDDENLFEIIKIESNKHGDLHFKQEVGTHHIEIMNSNSELIYVFEMDEKKLIQINIDSPVLKYALITENLTLIVQ